MNDRHSSEMDAALVTADPATQYAYALSQWETDRAQAVKWLVKAAERGLAQAQLRLGRLYETGEGLSVNAKMAVLWYKRAALQELGEAQYRLGLCYARGFGLPWDSDEANYWFSKSEENGYRP